MTIAIGEATRQSPSRNCPECKSSHTIEYREEDCIVCMDCGSVIDSKTAKHDSRENSNASQRKNIHSISCGDLPISLVESKRAREENLVQGNITLVLEKWKTIKISDSTEKNLALALFYITKIAVDLSLPKIVLEKASAIYKKITERGLIKGRSMKAVCAATLYIACKQCRLALTMNDIAYVSKTSPKKIKRSCRSITSYLDFPVLPTRTDEYAIRLLSRLALHAETSEIVKIILKVLGKSKLLIGKDPVGVACGAIYIGTFLTGERKTQREIAEVARITEATIRTRCRDIERSLIFSIHL